VKVQIWPDDITFVWALFCDLRLNFQPVGNTAENAQKEQPQIHQFIS
jgi:hypothetical protein